MDDTVTPGGMTGSSDGAPFSTEGSSPTDSDHSANPSGMTAAQLHESAAHDHPIQADPMGSGIAAMITGGFAAAATTTAEGVRAVGHVVVGAVSALFRGTGKAAWEAELGHGGTHGETEDAGPIGVGPTDEPDATVPDATVAGHEAPLNSDETPPQHDKLEFPAFEDGTVAGPAPGHRAEDIDPGFGVEIKKSDEAATLQGTGMELPTADGETIPGDVGLVTDAE